MCRGGAGEACGTWTPVEGQMSHKPRKIETRGPALTSVPFKVLQSIGLFLVFCFCIDDDGGGDRFF